MKDLVAIAMLREVARTGSFSGAARALGFSQPAVSQQMAKLEQRYGAQLVVRLGGQFVLTPAGTILAQRGATAIASLAAAEEEIAELNGLSAGRVRLAVFPSFAATLAPQALASMSSTHPNIDVSMVESRPDAALSALETGDLDIAVLYDYVDNADAEIEEIPLLFDPVMVVLPRTDPLAQKPVVALRDLRDRAWISAAYRSPLPDLCRSVGFEPRIRFTVDSHNAAQGLVAAGLGVALITRLNLLPMQHPGVVVRPCTPTLDRRIAAMISPIARRQPSTRALMFELQNAVGRYNASLEVEHPTFSI